MRKFSNCNRISKSGIMRDKWEICHYDSSRSCRYRCKKKKEEKKYKKILEHVPARNIDMPMIFSASIARCCLRRCGGVVLTHLETPNTYADLEYKLRESRIVKGGTGIKISPRAAKRRDNSLASLTTFPRAPRFLEAASNRKRLATSRAARNHEIGKVRLVARRPRMHVSLL
ncbi:hypothetical protein PUN28_019837 [Cardiocondyla obscurior]|uniref:Uncharacterized protein n=1 Tax=Cardiocondyla obscurior TaxID=286306 RepID=A0AAW2EDJ2_9HYME